MKNRLGIIFAVVLSAVGLYAFVTALGWRYMEVKLLPLITSGIIFLLGLNQLRMELSKAPRKANPEVAGDAGVPAEDVKESRQQWRRFGGIMLWLFGLIIIICLTGYIIATLIFCFVYVKTHGRSWQRAALYAVGVTAVFYGIFIYALNVQLYHGLFAFLF